MHRSHSMLQTGKKTWVKVTKIRTQLKLRSILICYSNRSLECLNRRFTNDFQAVELCQLLFSSLASPEAFVAEKNFLINFKSLIDRSIETLHLWQVLNEHNFEEVILHLEPVRWNLIVLHSNLRLYAIINFLQLSPFLHGITGNLIKARFI